MRDGRGRMRWGSAQAITSAPRIALTLSGTAPPTDAMALHTCDNPPCCNPRHLYVGDALANARDCQERHPGLHSRPILTPNPRARLSENEVRLIAAMARQAGPRSNASIGRRFGVSRRTVRQIVVGDSWRYLGVA